MTLIVVVGHAIIWLGRQVVFYLPTHKHTCGHASDTTVLTGSEAMDGEWCWGESWAGNENGWPGENGGGERERGEKEVQRKVLQSWSAVFRLAFSSSSPHHISRFIPPFHSSCSRDLPYLITPLIPTPFHPTALPRSASFFIKPCALHAKWAHSPIQYLPRHDGRDVYIKTDKAKGVEPQISEVTQIHTGAAETGCSLEPGWRQETRFCRCLRFARR